MSKKVGVEIGYKYIKVVEIRGRRIDRIMIEPIPENLTKAGRFVDIDEAVKFLKWMIKKNRVRSKDVYLCLSDRITYTREISFVKMKRDEVLINLPMEFYDYVDDSKDEFIFDYVEKMNSEPDKMEIYGVAMNRKYHEHVKKLVEKSGMRYVSATPSFGALISVAQYMNRNLKNFAFIDVGSHKINFSIFTNRDYEVSKIINLGGDMIDGENSEEIIRQINLEAMRIINFHNYNHSDLPLEHLFFMGISTYSELIATQIGNESGIPYSVDDPGELRFHKKCAKQGYSAALMAIGAALYEPSGRNERKKHFNLVAAIPKKRGWFPRVFICIIIALVCARLNYHFYREKMLELQRAAEYYREMSTVQDELILQNENYAEVLEEYNRYRNDFYNKSESELLKRYDVISMIDTYIMPMAQVNSYRIAGQQATVDITDTTLPVVSQLVSMLYLHPAVKYVRMSNVVSVVSSTNKPDQRIAVSLEIELFTISEMEASDE